MDPGFLRSGSDTHGCGTASYSTPLYKYLDSVAGKSDLPRKKAKCREACHFCRKSRIACDDGRPCQRCIKRKIGHLCQSDACANMDASANTDAGLSYADVANPSVAPSARPESGLSGSNEPGQAVTSQCDPVTTSIPPEDSSAVHNTHSNDWVHQGSEPNLETALDRHFETALDRHLALDLFSQWSQAALDPLTDPLTESIFRILQPPASAQNQSLSDYDFHASRSPEMDQFPGTEAFQSTRPSSHPTALNTYVDSVLQDKRGGSSVTSSDSNRQRDVTDADTLPSQPYNYTFAYALVAKCMATQAQSLQLRLSAATASFRPILHARLAMYSDEQHIAVEQQLQRTTRQLEEFLKFLPLPSCIFRRTGQILAGNRNFCEITGLAASRVSSRQLAIYEVLSPTSFVAYWEAYAKSVVPALQSPEKYDIAVKVDVMRTRSSEASNQGDSYSPDLASSFVMNCSISFDLYGLPLLVLAVLAPTC